MHDRILRQIPAEVRRVEDLCGVIHGTERNARQRLDIDAAEQMVHGRVARQHYDADHLAARQPLDHLAEACANRGGERGAVAQGEFDPAHHVRAVHRLRIERRFHGQDFGRAQVDGLQSQRGGAEINRDADAIGRFVDHATNRPPGSASSIVRSRARAVLPRGCGRPGAIPRRVPPE